MESKLVNLLDILYRAAPKEHNKFGFESEFQSRVRASLNSRDLKSFISKLIRKLGIKIDSIYTKENEDLFDFSDLDEKEAIAYLRENLEYVLVLGKIKREQERELRKTKYEQKNLFEGDEK